MPPWRQRLFVWEEALERELMASLLPFSISLEADSWVWSGDASGAYLV